jgi:hypothetical protein
MKDLRDPRPDAARDRALRAEVNARFLDSFRTLLASISEAGIEAGPSIQKIDTLDASRKLSGMWHVVYDRLLAEARNQDGGEIERLLGCLSQIPDQTDQVRVVGWYLNGYPTALHELYYDACDESFRNTYGVHFDGENNIPGDYDFIQSSIRQAIDKMAKVDPEIHAEFRELVSDVMTFHSPTMNAATSLCALGIIRVSQLREGQNWTRYFENLVHEAAHHHLNYLWFADPIVLNEDAGTYSSPLRREKRPLSGIYHAMFVLARTMRAVRALEAHPDFDPATETIASAYNNAGNSASFAKKFEDCWSVLKEHARLTELGAALMANTREMAFGA